MTTDETPRTEAGSGMIRWTLTGPLRMEGTPFRAAPPEPRRSWMERGTDAMNEADERAMRMGPNACPDCGGGHAAWCEAAPQGQPLDMERLREHEPEPPLVSDRWDCSCGWHQRPAVAQDWITHVLARLAESSEHPDD